MEMTYQFSMLTSDIVPDRDPSVSDFYSPDPPTNPPAPRELVLCELRYGLCWNYIKDRLSPAYIAYVLNVKTADIPAVDREYARWKITSYAARWFAHLGLTPNDIVVHFTDERVGNSYCNAGIE
jgi:hypothetical protein